VTAGAGPGRRFEMVDVFASEPLRGNPLPVVVDADGLDGDDMMRITRWMNQSETTFLLPPTDAQADYRVRIFTLERELPFAGHPTLGTGHVWLGRGGKPRTAGRIVQQCGAGLVTLRPAHGGLSFAAPPLLRSGPVDEDKAREVATVLGIPVSAMRAIEWADNGPGWLVVLLDSAQAVLDLEPARHHPSRLEIGVAGPYPEGHEFAYELRALFSDAHGNLLEDPVTGSLNASIAQWLIASGRVRAPYVAHQGTRLGRSGRVRVEQDQGETWIGGRVTTIVEGCLEL